MNGWRWVVLPMLTVVFLSMLAHMPARGFVVVLVTIVIAAVAAQIFVAAALFLDHVVGRRTARRSLLADAERQHGALMAGNDVYGVYGDYPPTPGARMVIPGPPL